MHAVPQKRRAGPRLDKRKPFHRKGREVEGEGDVRFEEEDDDEEKEEVEEEEAALLSVPLLELPFLAMSAYAGLSTSPSPPPSLPVAASSPQKAGAVDSKSSPGQRRMFSCKLRCKGYRGLKYRDPATTGACSIRRYLSSSQRCPGEL